MDALSHTTAASSTIPFFRLFSVKYQKFHVLQMQSLYQTKTLSQKSGTDQMYPCMTQA